MKQQIADYSFVRIPVELRYVSVDQEIIPITCVDDKLIYLANYFNDEKIAVTKILILARNPNAIHLLHTFLREFVGLKCSGFCQGYTQQELEIAVADFIRGITIVLVTSFQLSKGLGLPDYETLFVHDMPREFEEYIAEVDRVGMIGNPGKAIVFFNLEKDMTMACPLSDHQVLLLLLEKRFQKRGIGI